MSHQLEKLDDRVSVVRIDKTLDFRNADEFKAACQKHVEAGVRHFILDFSKTALLDSTALGAIFSVYRQVSPDDGQLAFAATAGPVKMVVEMTKLHRVFGQYPTVEAAHEALSA